MESIFTHNFSLRSTFPHNVSVESIVEEGNLHLVQQSQSAEELMTKLKKAIGRKEKINCKSSSVVVLCSLLILLFLAFSVKTCPVSNSLPVSLAANSTLAFGFDDGCFDGENDYDDSGSYSMEFGFDDDDDNINEKNTDDDSFYSIDLRTALLMSPSTLMEAPAETLNAECKPEVMSDMQSALAAQVVPSTIEVEVKSMIAPVHVTTPPTSPMVVPSSAEVKVKDKNKTLSSTSTSDLSSSLSTVIIAPASAPSRSVLSKPKVRARSKSRRSRSPRQARKKHH